MSGMFGGGKAPPPPPPPVYIPQAPTKEAASPESATTRQASDPNADSTTRAKNRQIVAGSKIAMDEQEEKGQLTADKRTKRNASRALMG